MKKKLYGIMLITLLLISSCTTPKDDISHKGYKYVVIDTTSISKNGFGSIFGYHVIVEMDSSLYSAYMNKYGVITQLNRKLKVRK